ncbi:MAG: Type 1 glutamine amidotransferase-like domain-containing protein, partial [Anaerolineales bacterium]|nr:Type 1 glutamine amidotransferase-like domain-containing protein [Anaerolineales bacterium]
MLSTALLALVGSGEYLPGMAAVDRRLLAAAAPPTRPARVACLPTAAGQEGEAQVERWLRLGVEHFRRLGAEPQPVRVVDRATADDPAAAAVVAAADLIYFSGGDPVYLYESLAGSQTWAAVQGAQARGAVLAGCSAGAMIMAHAVPDVRDRDLALRPAFGLVPAAVILPHFDRLEGYRPGATALAQGRLRDGQFALGIDEDTALIGRPAEAWEVQGAGAVTVLTR